MWVSRISLGSPFGGIPRNWKHSLEIGNTRFSQCGIYAYWSSPFGGIPRNWKRHCDVVTHHRPLRSPFGGIPRNWKHGQLVESTHLLEEPHRSPFGGIPRNWKHAVYKYHSCLGWLCSPFGGIPRNWKRGKLAGQWKSFARGSKFPLRGDP